MRLFTFDNGGIIIKLQSIVTILQEELCMSISIAKTIKTLRARKGITQEQLASFLGVTYQAISKWERDEGYPDITMLPLIANFFEISTDELLGVDVTKKQKAIEEIITNANAFYHHGDLVNTRRILEDGLSEYPNAHRLLLELVQLKYESPYGNHIEKDAVIESSIVTLERILDESTDSTIRNFATALLIRHYLYQDERQKALDLAKTQTNMNNSSTILLCDLIEGDERLPHIQQAIRFTLEELNGLFSRLGNYTYDNGYTLDQKIAIRELGVLINETVLGDEAHIGFGWNYWKRCEMIAHGYAMKGDADNAISWLEKAAAIACAHDALPEQITYTVLPLKGCVFNQSKTTKNYQSGEYEQYAKRLQNKVYDTLRNDPRFQKLV